MNNCIFEGNYANQGGLMFIQLDAKVIVTDSQILRSTAIMGGVIYSATDG